MPSNLLSLCKLAFISVMIYVYLIIVYDIYMVQISELQVSDNVAHNPKWEEKFYIESLVEVKILEKKEFGVLVGLSDHCDIFGFITNFHC